EYFVDQPNFLLVDAGHYETEHLISQALVEALAPQFPQAEWHVTRHLTNPMQVFVPATDTAPTTFESHAKSTPSP
ncbi:hypothetical protein RZS08_44605, partial [Arthrospira platensis SPKY1]|nr:hypothetical protein [Arthrospira platensis SPKY1]